MSLNSLKVSSSAEITKRNIEKLNRINLAQFSGATVRAAMQAVEAAQELPEAIEAAADKAYEIDRCWAEFNAHMLATKKIDAAFHGVDLKWHDRAASWQFARKYAGFLWTTHYSDQKWEKERNSERTVAEIAEHEEYTKPVRIESIEDAYLEVDV